MQHHHERHRGDVGELVEAETIGIPSNQPASQPIDQEEPDERHHRRQQDRSHHVAQHVMAHLVAHHDEQLVLVELGDQGVPEDDPLGVRRRPSRRH